MFHTAEQLHFTATPFHSPLCDIKLVRHFRLFDIHRNQTFICQFANQCLQGRKYFIFLKEKNHRKALVNAIFLIGFPLPLDLNERAK